MGVEKILLLVIGFQLGQGLPFLGVYLISVITVSSCKECYISFTLLEIFNIIAAIGLSVVSLLFKSSLANS